MHERVCSKSQKRTLQSCEEEAIVNPDGSTSREVTASECARIECVHAPDKSSINQASQGVKAKRLTVLQVVQTDILVFVSSHEHR